MSQMQRRSFITTAGLGAAGLLSTKFAQAAGDRKTNPTQQPNIIVILCDDLGYADIEPYGAKNHQTPHLNRMAAQGRQFTDFYVTSGVCSPSRASIMTGCYPRRVGLHQNETGAWVLFPGNKRGLNPKEVTIAEILKNAGYATAAVGKWHLGDQPEFLPTKQGFDSYFGIPYSNDMGHQDRPKPYHWPPLPLLKDEEVIEEEPNQAYITRRYTTASLRFIEENKDRPFFLYLAHTMPHWPQYSSPKFAGKSDNGAWGDAVEEIDWSTGRILDTLKELNLEKNTLVVFLSDNGGAVHHGASNAPLTGGKGTTWEGGHRVPCLAWWPGQIPKSTSSSELATSMDFLPTFAQLAGGQPPQDRVIDGKNIWPLLAGQKGATSPHDAYYYYFKGELKA
ncbi:sulfatase-like hydrolase/transferase, partial [bacterium]|nr:sulfatase-like hydrolase/transferase [bacterium]